MKCNVRKKRKLNNPKWCTMCDVREPTYIGTFKCSTCNCWMCNKHIEIMKQYNNQCPGCWCSNDDCFLCNPDLTTVEE